MYRSAVTAVGAALTLTCRGGRRSARRRRGERARLLDGRGERARLLRSRPRGARGSGSDVRGTRDRRRGALLRTGCADVAVRLVLPAGRRRFGAADLARIREGALYPPASAQIEHKAERRDQPYA